MNNRIAIVGLLITILGISLFSSSSVTILSEFDNIPTGSFITYYANITTIPLPFANYKLELTNSLKEPEYDVEGKIITDGDYIDFYIFDEENYNLFKGCGTLHSGPIECRDWKAIVEKKDLTGTYTRILDPKLEKVTVVVHNKNTTKIIQNSINIRMESQYTGLAALVFIIGLVVFYIGIASKPKKITKNKRVNFIDSLKELEYDMEGKIITDGDYIDFYRVYNKQNF